MKGDFSRNTFDARKHFSRVLMQQGRVQLDADWNEQASILLHYLQTLAADLIGPHGGPEHNAGFEILGHQALTNDFLIGPGRYYVDGILCELDADALRIDSVEGTPPTLTVPSLKLDNRQLAVRDWLEIEDDKGWHAAQIAGIDLNNRKITVTLATGEPALENPVRLRRLIAYRQQPDYPNAQLDATNATTFLVYLDVWERHITAIEDGRIREVALGGPDTATRAKVVWQARVTDTRPYEGEDDWRTISCDDMQAQWPKWVNAWQARSACQLKVRLDPEHIKPDPCTIAPTSAYRGQENQLYRVEIHTGSNQTAADGRELPPTFKWSRDNGSIVAAWVGNNEDGAMLVSNTHGFGPGQWIEITTEAQDLLGQPGSFVKIVKVEGGALYLETPQTWTEDPPRKVRRWDHAETKEIKLAEDGAVPIPANAAADEYIDLEDGMQIQFQPNGNYRTGDYWLIPARTTGAIEWPVELGANGQPVLDTSGHPSPSAQPPHGITHRYAPLRLISVSGGTVSAGTDLRRQIAPGATC
jgi:hypothetical protein